MEGTPVRGRFLGRPNRFVVDVEVGGRRTQAYLPTTGRLGEILVPDAPLLLHPKGGAGRRLGLDVWAGRHGGEWVGLDARVGAPCVRDLWPRLRGVPRLPMRAEARLEASRLDFALGDGRGWVEVKTVTLVEGRMALFPDAPTVRGRRHVDLLAARARRGEEAFLVFAVARHSPEAVLLHTEHDPSFAESVREAVASGVRVLALAFRVTPSAWVYDGPRPFVGG